MLYLAEVQVQKGFMANKAQLKLLACQRTDQSWSAVPGEELIGAPDDAANLGSGALVLAELNNNKQVQRLEQSRQLVNILQNFSKQQEKLKIQEEEIEQWKQSLTYQSQELNRREMEMEAEREQLEQMKKEVDRLDAQRQEIDHAREESLRRREELDRKSQELESAWQQLRNEMQRLEQEQAQLQQASGLNEEHSRNIQDLINRLSGSIAPTDSLQEQLNAAFELVNYQQEILNQHWNQWEQKRAEAEQIQNEVNNLASELPNRWQQWHQSQESLEEKRAGCKVQQNQIIMLQEQAEILKQQLQNQEQLRSILSQLKTSSPNSNNSSNPVPGLDNMPLEQLQAKVQELEREWESMFNFIHAQEEELAELERNSDEYKFLNETIEGQRSSLGQKEQILSQHQVVLWRRQGRTISHESANHHVDVSPIIQQMENQGQKHTEELQKLENLIQELQENINQSQSAIEQQTKDQENKRNELKQQEENLVVQKTTIAETWGRLNIYQEMLEPVQNRLNEIRQKLEEIAGGCQQIQEYGNYQYQTISEMQQIISSLTNA